MDVATASMVGVVVVVFGCPHAGAHSRARRGGLHAVGHLVLSRPCTSADVSTWPPRVFHSSRTRSAKPQAHAVECVPVVRDGKGGGRTGDVLLDAARHGALGPARLRSAPAPPSEKNISRTQPCPPEPKQMGITRTVSTKKKRHDLRVAPAGRARHPPAPGWRCWSSWCPGVAARRSGPGSAGCEMAAAGVAGEAAGAGGRRRRRGRNGGRGSVRGVRRWRPAPSQIWERRGW